MLRKLIKISLPIKIVKCIIVVLFFSELSAQFKEANITFDDRLLRDDEKSSLFNLKNAIQRFYVDTVWNDEYRDLELKLNIQVIFEGNANTGSSESFLIQSLFSNNMDLHFFDKGSQFSLSQNSSLYYDSVYYDPLSSLLGFYGNIILGAELDTWSSLGGSQHYEKARSIAVRASASNFSRGWEQRLLLINLLTDNVGLRKLRFSTYLSYELFENGNIDECIVALDELIKNLDEIFNNSSIEKHLEIPERFARPYEKKSWEQYKKLFIKESRIVAGVKFYSENKDLVFQVSKKYNVDPFIILSIVGIESNYGRHYKGFTVFNSLYTQIHEMPKRAKWASNELASYLEYCYKDNVDPQSIEGSYAGAFGFGQFIPSSFNRYSVDFDDDGVRRPHDWPDVLGSIANYLVKNGYNPGSKNYAEGGDIWKSVWAYNHSDNYVMAVLGLAEKIRERSSYLHSDVENRLKYVIENFNPLDNKSVSDLQRILNANGYDLEVDGRLGQKTIDALRDAQSKKD